MNDYRRRLKQVALIHARYKIIQQACHEFFMRQQLRVGCGNPEPLLYGCTRISRDDQVLEMDLLSGSWSEVSSGAAAGATGFWNGTREQLDQILGKIFNMLKISAPGG